MDHQLPPEQHPDEPTGDSRENSSFSSQNQYAYFYSRASAYSESERSVFAPPVKLESNQGEPGPEEEPAAAAHSQPVYHRRSTEDHSADVQSPDDSYLAREENQKAQPGKASRKRSNPFWLLLLLPLALVIAIVVIGLQPEQKETAPPSATASASETTVPQAASAFSAYSQPELSSGVQERIQKLAPTLSFADALQSDTGILLRQPLSNGLWDFYLFSSESGKLIAYYEQLSKDDAFFQADGSLYVKQAPFVLKPDGSPVVTGEQLEQKFGAGAKLHPFYGNWAAVEDAAGEWGFINADGESFSNLEYAKVFPFGSEYTVAYLDTGSSSQNNERYILYLLNADGSTTYWKNTADMDEIVLCAMNLAITEGGDIYCLPDLASPAFHSSHITLYPDYDAIVLKDDATGKFKLYVHGEAIYSSAYDSIVPVESELPWKKAACRTDDCTVEIVSLSPQLFSLPATYSFALQNQKQTEYVSLSLTGHDPLLLDGELPSPMEVIE